MIMFRRELVLVCVVLSVVVGFARAEALFHWSLDGPIGQTVISDVDLVGGVTMTMYTDVSAIGTETVVYGEPNPWCNTTGASADFQNNPTGNDPGAGLYANDPGEDMPMDLSTLQSFTIEAFVYPRTLRQCVIVRKWGGAGRYYLELRTDGESRFVINDDANFVGTGVGTILPNTWYHIAGVFDAGDPVAPMKIYLNGELAGTAVFNDMVFDSEWSLGIGSIVRDNLAPPGDSGQFYDGLIDEVRISSGVLSPSDFLISPPELARNPYPGSNSYNIPVNAVLSWEAGSLATSHDVYFGTSADAVANATKGSAEYKGSQALGSTSYDPPGDLALGGKYYWRIDEINPSEPDSPWVGRVWAFTVVGRAYDPEPSNYARDVNVDVKLNWTAGVGATSHDVYIGTSLADVNDADNSLPVGSSVYKGNQAGTTYTPALEFDKTYYWRIDEVRSGGKIIKGDIWRFSVSEYLLVDNFETYDSAGVLTEWESLEGAWVNISTTISRGGSQSLENSYYNVQQYAYSAAARTFDSPRDWTAGDIKFIQLYFYGDAMNDLDPLYVTLEDSSGHSRTVEYDGDLNNLKIAEWHQWRIELSKFGAQGVNLGAVKKLVLGVGDSTGSKISGAMGYVYFDDIRLYPPICDPELAPAGDLNDDCVVNLEDFGVMSDEWLASSYTLTGTDPGTSDLLLWYKFDETADANAMDSSGNGHTGTFRLGGGLVTPAWDPTGGYHDGALVFDDDTAVYAPNDVFAGAGEDLTICVWIAGGVGTVGRDNTVVDIGIGEARYLSIDIPDVRGDVPFQVGDANNVLVWDDVRTAEWLDLWNHYAFVKDSGPKALRIYANGRLVAEQTGIGQAMPIGISNATFRIGAQLTHNNDFVGKMDDLKVYKKALTDAEVVGAASNGESLYVPVRALSNLREDEEVNFMDLALLVEDWLIKKMWP